MIGLFDSGVGGLTILREVRSALPDADLLYVSDRGRAPYGTKSLAEVEAITVDVGGWLINRGATCVVVACNTASAAGLETLRSLHPDTPIVGMEPAVKPAALASKSGKVAVLATAATFQGRLFESVVSRFAAGVEVATRACPEWVELVEAGEIAGPRAEEVVDEVLGPLAAQNVDVVVLACTHFSFLRPLIETLSPMEIIDPSAAVAAQTQRVARGHSHQGNLVLAASGDTNRFADLARRLASIAAPVIPFPS